MPRGSDIRGAEIVAYLQRQGFVIVAQKGSHVTLRNNEGIGTTIPVHNKPIGKGLFTAILRQVGIRKDDFLK